MSQINVIYGTVYGSAHFVATELCNALSASGHEPWLHEKPTRYQLSPEHPLFVITSTTGDGELPLQLQPLLQSLQQSDISLKGLRYALAALGDSTYSNFCGGGHALARAFDHCGAQALAPVLEIDVCHSLNPEDEALPWALKLIEENK